MTFAFGSIEALVRFFKVIKSNRGQLSIFMGITLILVMGMLAFIVNIGLFVKAKINLQNAVDAAAFSGAATQARQLTNIAYVNWEMRNTYKEWMFKYYILGQMALIKGTNNLSDGKLAASVRINFLLERPNVSGNADIVGFDKYNAPSICIHNNSSTDICSIYNLPGIPRFPALGVAGITEAHEALVNKLVDEKSNNCVVRSTLNFLAALSWAYSSGIREIAGSPRIATNRAGAWPEALELAMRIRNLEMIMNRPPVNELKWDSVNNLANMSADIGLNERPIKAFMSAFRNLGGGKYKDALETGAGSAYDELPATFKLTELAPEPFQAQTTNVSGFLIPPTFTYPGDVSVSALTKHYVDLQATPINYSTIFSTFTPMVAADGTTPMEGSCSVSKTALPVPGYILGFVKNPEVLTYYAVKGEANFTGLFFPGTSGSFKLTAYAAAKPHGGRIGPKLFSFKDNGQTVQAREDDNSKTSSYLSGLELPVSTAYDAGSPIPNSQSFWANGLISILGGVPESGLPASYGIPNLIFDFNNQTELDNQNTFGVNKIQMIKYKPYENAPVDERRGLYQSFQLRELKKSLDGDFTGTNMTSNDLLKALIWARRVTKYDAANYLIPSITSASTGTKANIAPYVHNDTPTSIGVGYNYKLFAPLYGERLLYKTKPEIGAVVNAYIRSMDSAVETYLASLLEVGNKIFNLNSGVGAANNVNAQAAKSIHANAGNPPGSSTPPPLNSPDPYSETGCNYKDLASKFNHFFRKVNTMCGIVPLEAMMIDYIEKKNQGAGQFYYTSTYFNPSNVNINTAYFPSTRLGSDSSSLSTNPIGATTESYSLKRNFYSTKFIPLNKVLLGSTFAFRDGVFRESDSSVPIDMNGISVLNLIKADASTGLDNSFFRDF